VNRADVEALAAALAAEIGDALAWRRELAYSEACAIGPGIGWEPIRQKHPRPAVLRVMPAIYQSPGHPQRRCA
jgi:hypothetical protein